LGYSYLPDFSDKNWRASLGAAIGIKLYFLQLLKLRRKWQRFSIFSDSHGFGSCNQFSRFCHAVLGMYNNRSVNRENPYA